MRAYKSKVDIDGETSFYHNTAASGGGESGSRRGLSKRKHEPIGMGAPGAAAIVRRSATRFARISQIERKHAERRIQLFFPLACLRLEKILTIAFQQKLKPPG